MNFATIKTHDVANGPGVRVSLFVSGCTHRCPGCFNAEAWDFDYGQAYDAEVEERIIEALAPSYIKGFSERFGYGEKLLEGLNVNKLFFHIF